MASKLLENFSNDVKKLILEFNPNDRTSKSAFGDDNREISRKEKHLRNIAKQNRIKSSENSNFKSNAVSGEKDEFQKRTVLDKESAMDKNVDTVTPEEKKTQDVIYKFKIRLGKLELKNYVSNFIKSMRDFNKNVTKYKSEKDDVIKYLAPLKASMIALSGLLQSMVADLDKIEKEINGD